MLYGKKNVLDWFDDSEGAYFIIYRFGESSNGANLVYESNKGDNVTHTQARDQLDKALGLLNGKFDIVAMPENKRKTKGDWKISFAINQQEESQHAISGFQNMQPVISESDIDSRIKQGIEAYKKDQQLEESLARIKELEKENKELNDSVGDPWSRIGEVLMPFLPHLLGIDKHHPQVAGIPQTSNVPPNNTHFEESTVVSEFKLTEDEESRLANVITILHSVAPDVWLTKLEKLAAMVQQNPSMLNMIN